MPISGAFTACVEAAYWTNILPLGIRNSWKDILASSGYSIENQTWEFLYVNRTDSSMNTMTDYKLEIELDNRMTVTIPGRELFRPRVYEEDKIWKTSSSVVDLQLHLGHAGYGDKEPKQFFLGGPFLSQVYLMVNYEKSGFWLSNIDRSRNYTAKQSLARFPCTEVLADDDTKSKPTGLIIGSVIGGAGILTGIAVLIYFLFYSGPRKVQQQPDDPSTSVLNLKCSGVTKLAQNPSTPSSPTSYYPQQSDPRSPQPSQPGATASMSLSENPRTLVYQRSSKEIESIQPGVEIPPPRQPPFTGPSPRHTPTYINDMPLPKWI
ncbi:hypothetical protein FPQ18DRAFT_376328 [Pyronema domesticum]|nr:hypothetical protein FPQ18DRAFT_376328 [Pyronema domesticum]